MFDILYDIIVTPLIYIVELTFSVLYRVVNNPGIALIGVSLVVNFLCLPLYRMADRAQEDERDKQKSMERWVNHIKKYFKGDEQYMMLSTYYRQQNYKPISALRGSVSLLLQIPIFMAAYNYLSNLTLLKGQSFLFLSDLGAPDQMFTIAGFAVNVMPILMTLLNCVSTFIYTRDLALRDKIQAYGLAFVFLVLLYRSPSGLVFYWTCNQIFSLVKNVFFKVLKRPQEVLFVIAQLFLLLFGGYLLFTHRLGSVRRVVTLFLLAGVIEYLVISPLLQKRKMLANARHAAQSSATAEAPTPSAATFLLAGAVITALVGVLIPSALIADSPAEFIDIYNFVSPISYIVHTACVTCGLFVLWVGAYYYLSGEKGKNAIALALVIVAGIFVVDYFVFSDKLGTITADLVYSMPPVFQTSAILANAVAVVVLVALIVALWRYGRSFVNPLLGILAIAILALAIPNVSSIAAVSAEKKQQADEIMTSGETPLFNEDGSPRPIFTLSTKGHNVVVLFMDRAISGYLPYLLNERPDLVEGLDGFTFYPNTLSYGSRTVFGAPALYGGYDYTIEAINERDDVPLVDKHMESLSLLPLIFSQQGYDTTLLDPPLVDYQFNVTDYSNLKALTPETTILHTAGAYNDIYFSGAVESHDISQGRNFFFYSLFKAVPTAFRPMVYDNGVYFSTSSSAVNYEATAIDAHSQVNDEESADGMEASFKINKEFLDNYTVLAALSTITNIEEGSSDNLVIMQNSTTHTPSLLQLPDYVPSVYLNNEGLEDYGRFTLDGRTVDMSNDALLAHYHSNMATMMLLTDWFDYLRERGVYDNTRIVIVADHGYELGQFEDLKYDDSLDIEMVNPLFMVKDFNSHGFTVSDEFMTNGDTPALALQGLVNNPVNPYTGNPITMDEKNAEPQVVTTSTQWDVREYQTGNVFNTQDGHFYSVHDNIFDFNNWERLD